MTGGGSRLSIVNRRRLEPMTIPGPLLAAVFNELTLDGGRLAGVPGEVALKCCMLARVMVVAKDEGENEEG